MNKSFKLNQKTMLVVALLALVVFYLWSRNISNYAELSSSSVRVPSSYNVPTSGSYKMPATSSLPNYPGSYYNMPTSSSDNIYTGSRSQSSDEGLLSMRPDDEDSGYATLDVEFGASSMGQEPNCALGAGIGLASSLLPREVAKVENFGDFAPDDILRGQNFLDTRNQIGFPETLGGNIRNGNQQIRADPPNPKQPYVWNNSTIVPDLMQRDLCS